MAKEQVKIISEGMVKKGGLNTRPTSAAVRPAAQSTSNNQSSSSNSSSSNSGNNTNQ